MLPKFIDSALLNGSGQCKGSLLVDQTYSVRAVLERTIVNVGFESR